MFANERRNEIVEMVNDNGSVAVNQLSEQFNVSTVTIRNDLKVLQDQKLLTRTHGGAIKAENDEQLNGTKFHDRRNVNLSSKHAIAVKAAQLIHNGDCILLDASTTCMALARELVDQEKRITVITNGLDTATMLKENPKITTIVLGGVAQPQSNVIDSNLNLAFLNNFNIGTFFTSSYAISSSKGLSDFDLYEAELKRKMIDHCSQTIALVDHTKFDHQSVVHYADIKELAMVITDDDTPEKIKQRLSQEAKVM
ncbi:DeoR/GlpR family DNA-binding transcription regulator [Limosilactobacillus sp.]|uniref:DeoR/GlpR family DNA-binding transcription regulator n=1 Tax=Limosilactobacillus sp. TaxID=2773925 RepID=UPI00345E3D63